MKEPKVGEIWQWVANHKGNEEAYEHILSVNDHKVVTSLVATKEATERIAAEGPIGDEEWELEDFMKRYMYVW